MTREASSAATGVTVFCQPGFLHRSLLAATPMDRLPAPLDGERVDFYLRGSTALWHGLKLLPLKAGQTVLFPAYHCGIELDVLLKAGLRVEFYRVGHDLRIDPAELRRSAPPATRALFVIHYFGFPQPMGALRELCAAREWSLIEDCAHAIFAASEAGPVGTIGDIAVFSLHKALPLPCGGALVVNTRSDARAPASARPRLRFVAQMTLDVAGRDVVRSAIMKVGLGRRLRALAAEKLQHGRDRRLAVDGGPTDVITFHSEWVNARIPAFSMWLLRRIEREEIVERRRRNFTTLLDATRGCRHVVPLIPALADGACPGFFPVIVADAGAFVEFCRLRGVDTSRFWPRLHPAFPAGHFPDDAEVKSRGVVLPVHQDLDEGDLALVKATIAAWERERR